ncbi:MAG: hypothetical protein AB7H90_03445 [Alphaproteobacteria bacterium]
MNTIELSVDDLIAQRDKLARMNLDLEIGIMARDRRIAELEAAVKELTDGVSED